MNDFPPPSADQPAAVLTGSGEAGEPFDHGGCLPRGMKTSESVASSVTTVATRLAPEDLRPGQDVAILSEVHECPTWLWCSELPGLRADEFVRLQSLGRGSGRPLRIKAVCLPFVLVTRSDGKSRTLDVRRVQLVKLDGAYAKLTRKALRRNVSTRLPRP
jgi:hypothetical protein